MVPRVSSIRAPARAVLPEDSGWLNRLIVFGSDAPHMSTIEAAYDLRNEVEYVLGLLSFEAGMEPDQSWPYTAIVRELTEKPSYYAGRSHILVDVLVQNCGNSYIPSSEASHWENNAFSGLDTSAVMRARNRIDAIAGLLIELLEEDRELLDYVGGARYSAYAFDYDYADLGKFLRMLRSLLIRDGRMPEVGWEWHGDPRYRELRENIDALLELWPQLIVSSSAAFSDVMGLGIFMPMNSCGYGLELSNYQGVAFAEDTRWDEFAEFFVDRYDGRSVADDLNGGYGHVVLRLGDRSYETNCQHRSGGVILEQLAVTDVASHHAFGAMASLRHDGAFGGAGHGGGGGQPGAQGVPGVAGRVEPGPLGRAFHHEGNGTAREPCPADLAVAVDGSEQRTLTELSGLDPVLDGPDGAEPAAPERDADLAALALLDHGAQVADQHGRLCVLGDTVLAADAAPHPAHQLVARWGRRLDALLAVGHAYGRDAALEGAGLERGGEIGQVEGDGARFGRERREAALVAPGGEMGPVRAVGTLGVLGPRLLGVVFGLFDDRDELGRKCVGCGDEVVGHGNSWFRL